MYFHCNFSPTNPQPNCSNPSPGLAVESRHPKSPDVQNSAAASLGEAGHRRLMVSLLQSLSKLPFGLADSAIPLAVCPYYREQGDTTVVDRDRSRSYAK